MSASESTAAAEVVLVSLSREEVEIRKILLETPKIIVTIVAFLATSATILIKFDSNVNSEQSIKKYFYVAGVIFTIVSLIFTYNYITKIILSVQGRKKDEKEAEVVKNFFEKKYRNMMLWVSISVIYWILALVLFVFIA